MVGGMVQEFVDRVFDGATAPLLQHLIQENMLRPDEVNKLRQLLKAKS
jgi:predicted transcriptional regulator